MTEQVSWSCHCGKVALKLRTGEGTRAVCYCSACQTFPRLFGRGEVLNASGGTELYQTLPDLVTIERGAEHLGRLKLTGKGPLRWVATCCGSPLANTTATVQFPFVSLIVAGIDDPDALGPIRAQVNTDGATGPVPDSEMTYGQLLRQVMVRALKARLRGRHRPNPFFKEDGTTAGARIEITEEMRARA